MAQDIGHLLMKQLLASAKGTNIESDQGKELLKNIILGLSSNQQQPKQAGQASKAGSSSALSPGISNLSPALQAVQDSTIKAIKKMTEQNIAEAAEQQGPVETVQAADQLLQQISQSAQPPQGTVSAEPGLSMVPGMANQSIQPSTPLPGNSAINTASQPNFAQSFMKKLLTQGKATPEGEFEPASALFGLLTNPSLDAKRVAVAQGVQELRGEQPLQKGEREKLGIEFAKEQLKLLQEQEKAGTLDPNDIFQSFQKASGDFTKIRDAYSRVSAAASNPSPAGDLALIFNYMKILDPGSTVREGEFANAQNTGSVPQKIWAQYNKIANGKRLSGSQRKDFVDRSQSLFKSQERQQKQLVSEFEGLAKRNGINPTNVLFNTGLAQENQTPSFNSVQDAIAANLPLGTEILVNGRRAVVE